MFYLYLKTHNITGLKYLGQTKMDPYNYKGSGKYWTRHLKKHGYDVTTEILFQSEFKQEIKEQGLYYSNLWNIVESKEWANLTTEKGDGGAINTGIKWPKEVIEKIKAAKKGQLLSENAKQKIRENHASKQDGYIPPMLGKTHSIETKQKIRENSKINSGQFKLGYKHSEESKKNMSISRKGRVPWNKGLTYKKKRVVSL